ncbi:rod-determining factor RdfA [Haloarchaeobius sp. DFWS5]|uniref:rod-determining factor RdfA n=1 Tax=Haloarchaeobius sp. DFWS5 TaxID=3446114 RepID=UPI003EBD56E3
MTSTSTESDERDHGKVGRLVDEYDLSGLGDELERAWTGTGSEQASLRDLADRVNRRLLAAALARADVSLPDAEVATKYDLLAGDDVSPSARTQVRRGLERDGVDVEGVTRDFVSHQTVYRYLTNYRGVDHETSDSDRDRTASASQAMQRLASRTTAVAASNLDRLAAADDLTVGDTEVLVDVTVLCTDCGRSYDFSDLLARGHCACGEPSE